MTTTLGLLAVLGLILANGYFVAAEFAYVAVRRTRLEERAEAGDRRARVALRVLTRLSFMLSGAQLGITVTSLVVGFIADRTLGAALLPLVRLVGLPDAAATGVALTLGFVIATTLQMVIGELAPKNLAIARPEPFSLGLARSVWLYIRVAGPLIRLFDSSANRLLRLVGIEPVEELAGGVTAEELGVIIEQSSQEGALNPSQAALLARSLSFRQLRAVDAMVPRPDVLAVRADATCADLQALAVSTGHSRFPVVAADDLDEVVGVVQAKDILRVPIARRATAPVRALAAAPLAVPETALLGPLLSDLRRARTQLALVIDEHGGTAGIVTLEDVVEELVGDIADEYDLDEPTAIRLADGSYRVPGSWRLDEVARATGVELPEGDYDTVSGLVMDVLGRLPEPGDEAVVESVGITVESLHGRAVGEVLLRPASPEDAS